MPTPFSHIAVAARLLEPGRLPKRTQKRLRAARAAFFLGNTAPDFGALVGIARARTHFFEVPLRDPAPAHLRLLRAHPELARPAALDPQQAAFVAGYLAHLWLDQAWIQRVFEPYFGPAVGRGSFRDRLVAHNLLRAHLDLQQRGLMPQDMALTLRSAQPEDWLPFAASDELRHWRDHLAEQVEPDGHIRTVEVFAERLDVPQEQFSRRLRSDEEMRRAVYDHLPGGLISDYWRQGLTRTAELIHYYLDGNLGDAPRANAAFARDMQASAHSTFGRAT